MEYTDWYEHDVKPVRVGIYEIDDELDFDENSRCFAFFDGQYFGFAVWSDDGIIDVEELHSDFYKDSNKEDTWTNLNRWRGVVE